MLFVRLNGNLYDIDLLHAQKRLIEKSANAKRRLTVGIFFNKIDSKKANKYQTKLYSCFTILVIVNVINSWFLDWLWLYITTSSVLVILVVFLLKTPKRDLEEEWKHLEIEKDEAFENRVNLMMMNDRSDVQAIKYIRKEKNLGLLHAKQYLDRIKESKNNKSDL